jgi:hypothetical protein
MVTDLMLAAVNTGSLEAAENVYRHTTTAATQSTEEKAPTPPKILPHFTSNNHRRIASRHKINTGMRKSPRPSDVDASPDLKAAAGIDAATTNPSSGKATASRGISHGSQ